MFHNCSLQGERRVERGHIPTRPCTHKPSDVMRRTQCPLCPDSGRVRAAAQYVAMGQSRRFGPLLGRSDLPFKRRHEATDGFNRIRKRRTFDPGCSSPWVSSAAASGASKPKWMTKCPWLAFAEGGGEAEVCDGDRAGASVTRSHHAVKHE